MAVISNTSKNLTQCTGSIKIHANKLYLLYISNKKSSKFFKKEKERERVLKGKVSKAQIWSHHFFLKKKLASLKFEFWVNKEININEKKW